MPVSDLGRGILEVSANVSILTGDLSRLRDALPLGEVEALQDLFYETARIMKLNVDEFDDLHDRMRVLSSTSRLTRHELWQMNKSWQDSTAGLRMHRDEWEKFVRVLDRDFGRAAPQAMESLKSFFIQFPQFEYAIQRAGQMTAEQLRSSEISAFLTGGWEAGQVFSRTMEEASNKSLGFAQKNEALRSSLRRLTDEFRLQDKVVADLNFDLIELAQNKPAAVLQMKEWLSSVELMGLTMKKAFIDNPDALRAVVGGGMMMEMAKQMLNLGGKVGGLTPGLGAFWKTVTSLVPGGGLGSAIMDTAKGGAQIAILQAVFRSLFGKDMETFGGGITGGVKMLTGAAGLVGDVASMLVVPPYIAKGMRGKRMSLRGYGMRDLEQRGDILDRAAHGLYYDPRQFLPAIEGGMPGTMVNWNSILKAMAFGSEGGAGLRHLVPTVGTPQGGEVMRGLFSGMTPWASQGLEGVRGPEMRKFWEDMTNTHMPAFESEMSRLERHVSKIGLGGHTMREEFEAMVSPALHQKFNNLAGVLKQMQDEITPDTPESMLAWQMLEEQIDQIELKGIEMYNTLRDKQYELYKFGKQIVSARTEDELRFLDRIGGDIDRIGEKYQTLYDNEMALSKAAQHRADNWVKLNLTETEREESRQEARDRRFEALELKFRRIEASYQRQNVLLDFQQSYWQNIEQVASAFGSPLGVMAQITTNQLNLAQRSYEIEVQKANLLERTLAMHMKDPTNSPKYLEQLQKVNQAWATKAMLAQSFHRTVLEVFREMELGSPGGSYWMAPSGGPSGAQMQGSAYFPGRGLMNILTGAVTPFARQGGGQGTYSRLYGGLAEAAGLQRGYGWAGVPRGDIPQYNEAQLNSAPTKIPIKSKGQSVGELNIDFEAFMSLFGNMMRPNRSRGGVAAVNTGALR